MKKQPLSLDEFLPKMLGDLGAAASAPLVILGDRLGLFRSLAASTEPLDAAALAERAGNLDERYVREWLLAMAASDYVSADPAAERFSLSEAQRAVFADPDHPCTMVGGYYGLEANFIDEPRVAEAFRTGRGLDWGEHHECLFCGTARFYRPAYAAHLVQDWLPALDGMVDRLTAGAVAADVGCGHGCSTVVMARAFPRSRFVGFDLHPASIERAREHARECGVTNVEFAVGTAQDFPGVYDLVAFFDCLHDMGDPVGAGRHVREALRPDGAWLIVEPLAGDTAAENLNPVGRIYYSFSTMVCTPAARSQKGGFALGAQAGERRLREVIVDGAGFGSLRRAATTPFNLVLEARR